MTPEEFIADPNWAQFIPAVREDAHPRPLPTHEDCSTIDPEDAALHLRAGGTLGRMAGYEERPGQLDMLQAIVRAFNARQHLMVEAGTGVGKSLAYLIPAILWSWTNDTTVVISTATRNLQSQLIGSDIPRALHILGDHAKEFKVALLKGRTNYLCLKSVDEFFEPGAWVMSEEEREALPGFIEWLQTTKDGDLDTYEGLPRALLSRPGDECTGHRCPFHKQCFVYKARKKAADAHLVIANHALVLADATAGTGGSILPNYGRLILDEAHNLEDIATDYLSSEFSLPELTRILKRLTRHRKELGPRVAEVRVAAENYLALLAKLLPHKEEMRRFKAGVYYWKDLDHLKACQNAFERPLIELVHHLHDFCDTVEDQPDLTTKLSADADRLIAFANEAAFVVKGDNEDFAYWLERMHPPKRHSYVRLMAAPLSVAEELKKALYDIKDSVVLCSATLRVGNDFKYMTKRLGCVERFQAVVATSPFDYFRQSLVLAADCLPDPQKDGVSYTLTLAGLLKDLFTTTQGRALVLFTSYEMMNAVASAARATLEEAGFTLLVQGEGLSRESLTRRLKESPRSTVLFGAQSFWEGVDIPGEALSCVVLARLPFSQVKDPIVEARCERVERSGGNSFRDYFLPEAVIKFRQGFGRLIRTKADHGVVIVTDPRLVTKSYGAIFRKSIPATVHTVTGIPELIARTGDFLS